MSAEADFPKLAAPARRALAAAGYTRLSTASRFKATFTRRAIRAAWRVPPRTSHLGACARPVLRDSEQLRFVGRRADAAA